MSFTKRDYEAIARIIRNAHPVRLPDGAAPFMTPDGAAERTATVLEIQGGLASHFAADNPRFDAERFARACEPGGGK